MDETIQEEIYWDHWFEDVASAEIRDMEEAGVDPRPSIDWSRE